MNRLIRALLATSLLTAPLPALADVPPDLVRLQNGGMLRGTIVELVPGDKVTITLPTGETRTLSMAEVTYAGPAAEAPTPTTGRTEPEPKPMVTVRTGEARLALSVTTDEKLTWHTAELSGIAAGPGGVAIAQSFQRLCTAPCEVDMPVGTHRLALAQPDGLPIPMREAIDITGDGELVGRYVDNSASRIAAGVLGAVGVLAGLGLMLSPLLSDDAGDDGPGTGFYIGVGLLTVGAITPFLAPGDKTEVEYRPK